jgi:hypothetical protein
MNSLLDVFLCLFRSCVHFTDPFSVGLPTSQENFIDHFLAHLGSQDFIDLIIMEKCHFPVLMAEVLGEVLEVGSFVPLDVIEGDQLDLLVI